jgi:hypothetical protein
MPVLSALYALYQVVATPVAKPHNQHRTGTEYARR